MAHNTGYSFDTGDIVMISDFGNAKFIVCHGWYTYNSSRQNGWYFRSIPNGKIVPDYVVDIDSVTLVSSDSGGSCGCHYDNPCNPPHRDEPCGCEEDEKEKIKDQAFGSFVTVQNIDERNSLGNPFPVDGRLCRVNNVSGDVKYYVWNATDLRWDDFTFPTDPVVVESMTQQINQAHERISSVDSKVTRVETKINTVTKLADWVLLAEQATY